MINQRTRDAYRKRLHIQGSPNLSDDLVDQYIWKVRLRLVIFLVAYLPIFAATIALLVHMLFR